MVSVYPIWENYNQINNKIIYYLKNVYLLLLTNPLNTIMILMDGLETTHNGLEAISKWSRIHMTREDVARAVGVSKSTVSRVLNNNGYVSEGNRRNIEEGSMGYRPNLFARA